MSNSPGQLRDSLDRARHRIHQGEKAGDLVLLAPVPLAHHRVEPREGRLEVDDDTIHVDVKDLLDHALPLSCHPSM